MRSTILEQLSFEQKSQLSTLITKITTAFHIDQIICYGHKIKSKSAWTCHELAGSNAISSSVTLYLLIVPAKEERSPSHDIIHTVDSYNTPTLLACCIVHHAAYIATAIADGHPFFSTLHENGCLLYGKKDATVMQSKACSLQERITGAELAWKLVFTKAQHFLNGAAYCMDRRMPELTTFLLHQAIEQTAMALLRSLIGYRPDSHNLSRLMPLMEYAGLCMETVFPQNTQEEKELFLLLKRSYSDTRYKDDFRVPQITSEILYNRTEELLNNAEALFLQETNKWREHLDAPDTPPLNVAFINPMHQAS